MVCPSYWSLLAKWGVQDLNTHTFTTPLSTFLCTFSYHYTVVTFNATAPLFYSASLSLSSFVFPWETFLLNLYWYMYTVYKRYRLIQCTHDYSHTIVYIQTKIMKIQVNVIIWQLPMSTLDGFQNIFKRHYNKQQQLDTITENYTVQFTDCACICTVPQKDYCVMLNHTRITTLKHD